MDCNSGEVKQLERGSDLELIEGFGCGGTYKVSIIRNRKTGIPIAIRQVDIVDGKEVECQASDLKKYKMQIPKGFQNTDLDVLKLRDGHTGDFVGDVDIAQDLDIFPGIPVTVPKRDVSKVQSMIESLNDLEEK
jgi:hypothetical protein